ncbi:MAG: DMT family transporter [Rhodomicrobium sp.]
MGGLILAGLSLMQFNPGKPLQAQAAAHRKRNLHADRIALGMAASAASFFMLNTMNAFAKLLSPHHSVIEVAFYRNLIAALPFAVWFSLPGHRERLKIYGRPSTIVLRSVIGTVSLVATFKAFNALPMADAQALFFTSSLFVPVMGYLFLKEFVGPYRWSAVIVGFLGMLVIVRPSGAVNLTGVSFAVGAAFMHATLGTLLRVLGRTERPETVTFYFLAIGTALTALAMPFVATVPAWHEVPYFLGAGISGAFAQMFLSMAYKYAPVALVTIFNYTGIVWATAYGWFIWGDWPGAPVWTGAGIIIASSLFIVWRENRMAKLARLLGPAPTASGSG